MEKDRSIKNLWELAEALAELGRNGPGVRRNPGNAWREEAAAIAAEAKEKAVAEARERVEEDRSFDNLTELARVLIDSDVDGYGPDIPLILQLKEFCSTVLKLLVCKKYLAGGRRRGRHRGPGESRL